jgi:hypothetical protein
MTMQKNRRLVLIPLAPWSLLAASIGAEVDAIAALSILAKAR